LEAFQVAGHDALYQYHDGSEVEMETFPGDIEWNFPQGCWLTANGNVIAGSPARRRRKDKK